MKKFSGNSALLAASVAALLSSTAANAATDLEAGTGTRLFAKEINVESSPNVVTDTIQATAGFGFSSGANFYVRFDLDNSAKFGTAALTSTSMTTSAVGATITLAAGGTLNDNYAVFNVTAAAAGVGAADTFTLTAAAIKVANRNPVNVRYRLFTDAATAANPSATSTALKDKSATLLKFDTALGLSVVTAGSSTASVVDNFLKFLGSTPTVATVGSFKLANATSAMKADGTAVAAVNDIADLAASKSSLVINGDFGAAFDSGSTSSSSTALSRVWLAKNGVTCSTAFAAGNAIKPTAIAADGKSVTFGSIVSGTAPFDTAASAAGVLATEAIICYQPNTTTPIAVSDYTVTFKPVVTSTSAYASGDVVGTTFGSIKRNGAELQAPFANVISGYKSRIYLTNTGTQDAPFTMSVQTEAGTTFTPLATLPAGFTLSNGLVSGTIPKTGNVFFTLDQLGTFTAASGSTAAVNSRGALIFKVAADCNGIQGMFQLRNLTSGDFDSAPLLRPAGYCQ